MSDDTVGHLRRDWTVDISIDEHEGQTRAKARPKSRSASVSPGSIQPTARSMTSATNWPSRAHWPTWPDG